MTQCVTAPLLLQRQHQVPNEVRRLRSYLLENYTQSLTLDKMSQVAALNKYYLEKLFKKYVGYSPTQYLIHLRLTKSKELLRSTSMFVRKACPRVKVVTKINRYSFQNIIGTLDLGSVFNPRYSASNRICRYVRAMQNSMICTEEKTMIFVLKTLMPDRRAASALPPTA